MTRQLPRLATLAFGILLAACGRSDERGRRLFAGELPLTGRIVGHTSVLPPQASRCINCHALGNAEVAGGSASSPSGTQAFGGALSPQRLTAMLPRRGGPPSRFDEKALCHLLRTGVDPAYIVIVRSMPRYELSDADCHALWMHLSQRRHESPPAKPASD